jgi:PucR C-terminal helix-turn-helix domain/GGDEF-like domain
VRSAAAHSTAELAERLRERREEIEGAALTRVNAIADSSGAADPTYVEGLRSAVSAAVEYGLATIEHGDERGPPMPVTLLAQARMAVRSGVSLDTVLRRYFTGYSLLGYFIVEEASKDGLMSGGELQRLLGTQAVIFDRLLGAIGEEHRRESELLLVSSEQRHTERIERLLEGELIDTADIAYDFEGWHMGVIACGPVAAEWIRKLGKDLDLGVLLVNRGDKRTVWAWLGARRRPDPSAVKSRAAASLGEGIRLSLGEPASGLGGWRLTHRQSVAALSIAQRASERIARYGDVVLPAAVVQDDFLRASMLQLYLHPLEDGRDGGEAAKVTLRAYFDAERNISSAAASLGISRQAVAKRLRAVEEALGRPLVDCAAALEVALRVEALDGRDAKETPVS